MKVLTFYQTTLFTHSLVTPISYMHTHHYEGVRVLPDDTLGWVHTCNVIAYRNAITL